MLEALSERGIVPDIVLGTSIGAINGVAYAADPSPGGVGSLRSLWAMASEAGVFSESVFGRVRNMATTRTSLHSNEPLRRLLEGHLDVTQIEDLPIAFQCVASCIETASERWFTKGPIVDAVLASSAVPGLFPAVEVGGMHYLDGGVVDPIPVKRAFELGAKKVYVLQVGRIEEPLRAPRLPHEVAMVAFEIARRKGFSSAMASIPEGVTVHVLPTGGTGPRFNDLRQLRYRDFSEAGIRMDRAREATEDYLGWVEESGQDL